MVKKSLARWMTTRFVVNIILEAVEFKKENDHLKHLPASLNILTELDQYKNAGF